MRIVIIGGGFIGQLLHVIWPKARVFDWRPSAPARATRSLGPQYLWEPIPELTCRRFDVHTTVDWQTPTDERILAYKHKVGKEQDGSDWRAQFQEHMDGYDCQLPTPRVEYGKRVLQVQEDRHMLVMADGSVERYDLLISTIPLSALMMLCQTMRGLDLRGFVCRPIFMHHDSLHPGIEHDARLMDGRMHVNYVSTDDTQDYRQTVRDDRIYTESLTTFDVQKRGGAVVKIMPGKIYPNDHADRYVARLALESVVCFGRFASWCPDELAHETLRKVRRFKEAYHL